MNQKKVISYSLLKILKQIHKKNAKVKFYLISQYFYIKYIMVIKFAG